ncbi:MAG: hypothetical protein IH851_03810 [Armatimonadetes bacterium]|nr:hypothetical protein [Armatimonadota bacterium]
MWILFACLVSSIVLASILEGLLHQFVLHKGHKRFLWGVLFGAFRAHALEHHPEYRDDQYHRPAPEEESRISLGWYTMPIVLTLLSPGIWAVWAWLGMGAGLIMIGTIVGYYIVYETFHWLMHFPHPGGRGRWFQRWRPLAAIFDWFDKRHYVHHLADDRNFNVILPFYDWLTGRYTIRIEQVPWAIRLRTWRNKRRAAALKRRIAERRRAT